MIQYAKNLSPKCNSSIGDTVKCLCKNCPSAEGRLNGQNRVKSSCQVKYFVEKEKRRCWKESTWFLKHLSLCKSLWQTYRRYVLQTLFKTFNKILINKNSLLVNFHWISFFIKYLKIYIDKGCKYKIPKDIFFMTTHDVI